MRKRRHLKDAKRTKTSYRFHNAIRKYGAENFVFEMLFDFQDDEEMAKAYEYEMIAKWQPEYNIAYGGEGGSMPEEMRQRISATKKGRPSPLKGIPRTAEERANMSAAQMGHPGYNKGMKRSAEAIRKTSEANRGRVSPLRGVPRDEETRLKIGAGNKGKVVSEESRQRMRNAQQLTSATMTEEEAAARRARMLKAQSLRKFKPVRCLTDGRVFGSATEADKFYGFAGSCAGPVANGKFKTTHGMRFEYVKDDK